MSLKQFLLLIVSATLAVSLMTGCNKSPDEDHKAKEDAAATQARKGTFHPSSLKSY